MDISNLTLHVSIGGHGYPFYSSSYGWMGEWMVIYCESTILNQENNRIYSRIIHRENRTLN